MDHIDLRQKRDTRRTLLLTLFIILVLVALKYLENSYGVLTNLVN